MAENSEIGWLHPRRADGSTMPGHTANLWHGCEKIAPGCVGCYAEAQATRYAKDVPLWGADSSRKIVASIWGKLASWQKQAQELGEVHPVFTGSMMDIVEEPKPIVYWSEKKVLSIYGEQLTTYPLLLRYFNQVIPATPNLLHLLLSKRVTYNKRIPEAWEQTPPPNVMFGASVSDPDTLKTMVRKLRNVNGRRFLSIEPQVEEIKNPDFTGIDWVIQGGGSGRDRRPFNHRWAVYVSQACREQGIPYFFKQTGTTLAKAWGLQDAKGSDPSELPHYMQIQQFPAPFVNHNLL